MVQNECSTKVNNNATRRCIQQCRSNETSDRPENGLSNGHYVARSGSIPADTVNLKRRVGLLSGVALIVGTMIGSGIFVSPSELLKQTDSVAVSLIIWALAGGLAMLGALAYAELGTMNTSSGAEYAYFMDAFGSLPAFLFSWVSTLVLKPSQLAIIILTFAQYTCGAFMVGEAPTLAVKLVATATIMLLLFINCYSVNLATGVQNVFTAAKLVAIAIVCVGGLYKFIEGNPATSDMGFGNAKQNYGKIATAFYSGLWAYDGWNNLNYATEEIKNPDKNLPRSIMLGIPLVTVCYVFINIAYLFVMTPDEMIASEAVAVTFGQRVLGSYAWIIPLSVAISTFGAANGTVFAAGRLGFATSREGHFSDILSYIHVRRFTPIPALVFHAVIAIAMVIPGNIDSLINFFSFTAWIFYGGAMAALLWQRHTKPNFPRPYRVPTIAPILVLIISIYLVIAPIVENPELEYLYASLFIAAGLVFYIPFVHYQKSIGLMEPITIFLQKWFEVAPTEVMEEERCFLS
ncbi:unnamed protein product [Allacma fusca]|uniref:b(0,+)-type amino acid transporter 1 n=1 Tax=Allacma fusca TaxID=39272 RepID=A0A8J2P115_9HEXA|nr:unnamed protein product [Allacma fusca]